MDQVDRILAQWNRERGELDVGPMGTLGRFKRLYDHLMAGLNEVYSRHGLTAAGFDVLATLRRSGVPFALSPSELIASTMVTSGTMTNRLDKLEAAGLIERKTNPKDARGSVVALTPEGFDLIDRAVTDHVANQHRLLEGLTPDQRAGLDVALRAWLGQFEQPNDT